MYINYLKEIINNNEETINGFWVIISVKMRFNFFSVLAVSIWRFSNNILKLRLLKYLFCF